MSNDRKELVDWVRGIYQNLNDAEKRDAIRFFPELKESEDERIRKELISQVEKSKHHPADKARWIAYLEKQEQKPVERATMRDFNYHEGEPDEKAWSRLFAILNYAEATSDDTPGEEIQALTNWIEGKQKPAWSEEDESILNNIIAYRYLNVDDLEWIKKLPKRFNLQPKQEWSEEDETKLNDVIHIIEKHCGLVESIRNHYVKFLKRLRPSWKPSEKQMKGLKYFLDYHRPQRNAATTVWKEFDSVDLLYNDLLKLKSL